MSPAPLRSLISLASALVCALTAAAAQAQAPAAPAAPPSWQQGRNAEQEKSPLHPFAIEVTGKSAQQLPVDKLKVPDGFKVEVWAEGLPGARSMAQGGKGTVFVGTRQLKDVYAVVDRGGKREAKTLLKGLDSPNGIAFSRGTLYVAERHRITRYDGIESRLDNPPEAKVVVDGLDPQNQPGHFWKFLALGPDGKLYYNVGAPGNIVMPAYFQAAISRVDPRTGIVENYALGVRNSVGFDCTRRPSSCGSPIMDATGWAMSRRTTRCTWPRARASISAIPIAIRATRSTPSSARTATARSSRRRR